MAPKGVSYQATIIILDVGKNVSKPNEKKDKSFFQEAKECTSRLIERKIMSQGKNLIGIIMLGSKDTHNNMAEQCEGGFKHIKLHAELQSPTWEMIRNLPESTTKSRGDWVESLIVAADHFKNGISGTKLASQKIILMTNFQSPSNFSVDVERILDGFKEDGFEVDIIGPDIYHENQKSEDVITAKRFVEETNGVIATTEVAMQYLFFHKKKAVNAMPWNVDLNIGPNVKIPVSAYIKVKEEPVVKWIRAVKDPVTASASTTEGITRNKVHINTENQSVIDEDKLIKGYVYGQQVVPFSEHDKNMLYQSGDKCLAVYGFTHISNIKWQILNGDSLVYIFGRKGDTKAQAAVRCLVECLHNLNLAGIVRRVYNKGNAPKMYALMPVIDTNNFICLSLIGICYKEEIKYMAFPQTNLKKYECTKEQVNAFKDLINAMDLTNAYDDTYDDKEAFPIAETVSPTAQYILDCIAYRAMNPGKPLPEPRDEIMMLFKIPPSIEQKARDPLERLNKLFKLEKVEVMTKKRKQPQPENDLIKPDQTPTDQVLTTNIDDMPKVHLPGKKQKVNEKIGTINPINDFKMLINEGRTLIHLSSEMTDVIENLIYCNLDGNYSKALETMSYFRTECVKSNPALYNNWLQKFKTALAARNKNKVMNLIHQKKLHYILKDENSLSSYELENSQEDSEAYKYDTIPNSTELTIASEINDLFDEM